MHTSRVFAIIATLTCVNAWVIPEGAKEGTYAVVPRENGEVDHIRIAERNETVSGVGLVERSETLDLKKRGGTLFWCGCGLHMDHGNTDAAVADLSNQLNGHTIQPGYSFYSIRNNVVAFACNYKAGHPVHISGQNYGDMLKRITYVCGAYVPGTDGEFDTNYAYSAVFGYMNYAKGLDFCGQATGSSSSHC